MLDYVQSMRNYVAKKEIVFSCKIIYQHIRLTILQVNALSRKKDNDFLQDIYVE